jgi:hypothetical protein
MELAVNISTTALGYAGIGARINGAGTVYFGGWGWKSTSNAYAKACSTVILELAASDYIEVYIETAASHSILGGNNGGNTRWSGQLLS